MPFLATLARVDRADSPLENLHHFDIVCKKRVGVDIVQTGLRRTLTRVLVQQSVQVDFPGARFELGCLACTIF